MADYGLQGAGLKLAARLVLIPWVIITAFEDESLPTFRAYDDLNPDYGPQLIGSGFRAGSHFPYGNLVEPDV